MTESTDTPEITSVIDATAIRIDLHDTKEDYPMFMFRGHNEIIQTQPLPRIFRKNYNERSIIRNFMHIAPGLVNKVPNQDNYLNWLCLMQHHGTPTRLLDWTESILAALYFAVYELKNDSKDAEIYQANINTLNKASNLNLPPEDAPAIQYLAQEELVAKEYLMNRYNPDYFRKRYNQVIKIPPEWPIAFLPTYFWGRMISQKSIFTIHPKPKDKNQKIKTKFFLQKQN